MTRRRRDTREWTEGDLFAVTLRNGQKLLGQVLACEPAVLNSVSCALFDQTFVTEEPPRPILERLFALVLTTRDLLDNGTWHVVGAADIGVPRRSFPFEHLRSKGFVGAKVIGSKNVGELANAFCGLVPWDDWADPHYLDKLLISPDKKPANVVYKKK